VATERRALSSHMEHGTRRSTLEDDLSAA
jgi:hypothetical protein